MPKESNVEQNCMLPYKLISKLETIVQRTTKVLKRSYTTLVITIFSQNVYSYIIHCKLLHMQYNIIYYSDYMLVSECVCVRESARYGMDTV